MKRCWQILGSSSFASAHKEALPHLIPTMFEDQDLGFFANFLGIFIFILVIAYHFVVADPKFE
ncbi:PREDICTED: dolichyl-diphosphooligosaccharide--protein glycosyltransferase subunit 4C-like [Brassica oleracea var. oleracea]|uniref:dolichyl-diphosphooligosaccharide--protein glycosyltransferase subunit 4C-like n=1 Tax=Brassica oleracea var. oleracea TaxID=109376 RepID=UPI0006A702E1|nr:PREDICTED: dolichyl-diphosphooligosaccharide--protein glycosyltransferase subunit 4C-like [Brassica oleracea var. oleracea]